MVPKKLLLFLILYFLTRVSFASPLYLLSDSPPTEQPTVFHLPVEKGFAATERLAFNSDYTHIYYSQVNGYETDSESSVQFLAYANDEWQSPITLASEFNSPALSTDGTRLYLEGKNDKDVWYMNRKKTGWSLPQKLFPSNTERHYFAETDSGNYYYSSLVKNAANRRDFWRYSEAAQAQSHISLELGIASDFPRDFYIAKDESFLITLLPGAGASDVVIYFRQSDGVWSEPVSLGKHINEIPRAWKWGFFVSDDLQYLFLTSGNDLTDTRIYWSRFDTLLARLKTQ